MSDSEHPPSFQAPEIEEVAQLFPAYQIHDLIACGGMGAVYQATQISLDRVVAIKILPREFSIDEEFRSSFESEAKAMAKLNHPNLIGVYDFGEVDGMLFIVMEYVAGKSLYHSTQGSAVDQSDALRIVIDTCAGLASAHQHGILHRDIKPANILLDPDANPKIGDFGLARALENKIEEGEQIYGTPGYTAPEVLEPPYTFDQRADVFSVGVMLHELLTGQLPDADPRPPSQLSNCNFRLDAVIKKATHPDPASRYLTAAEFAAQLEAIASSSVRPMLTAGSTAAASTKSPKSIYAPTKYTAKKDSSGGTVFIVLLLIAGAIGAVVFFSKSASPEEVPPAVPENVENKTTPTVAPTPVEEPAAAFDPSAFLALARSKISGKISPLVESRKKELAANLGSFQDQLETLMADLDSSKKAALSAELEEQVADWKSAGSLIPEQLPWKLADVPGAPDLHHEFLDTQASIRENATKAINLQAGTYILSIENKIELLKDDQDSISALLREIRKVQENEDYFSSLFLR